MYSAAYPVTKDDSWIRLYEQNSPTSHCQNWLT